MQVAAAALLRPSTGAVVLNQLHCRRERSRPCPIQSLPKMHGCAWQEACLLCRLKAKCNIRTPLLTATKYLDYRPPYLECLFRVTERAWPRRAKYSRWREKYYRTKLLLYRCDFNTCDIFRKITVCLCLLFFLRW